ncbi:hypothetical protein KP509_1Z189200 [Ceratopteris richardii]|nr:hypothetical protein KP509_1Z189200 [Ceratopteris richardii]
MGCYCMDEWSANGTLSHKRGCRRGRKSCEWTVFMVAISLFIKSLSLSGVVCWKSCYVEKVCEPISWMCILESRDRLGMPLVLFGYGMRTYEQIKTCSFSQKGLGFH